MGKVLSFPIWEWRKTSQTGSVTITSPALSMSHDTRGNPEIDVNDIVYQENEFQSDMKVNIYRHTIIFNQSFAGKVTARRTGG